MGVKHSVQVQELKSARFEGPCTELAVPQYGGKGALRDAPLGFGGALEKVLHLGCQFRMLFLG